MSSSRDLTLEADRARLKIALRFLQHIRSEGAPLYTITQDTINKWVRHSDCKRSHVPRLKPFLDWLFWAGHTKYRLRVPKNQISPGEGVPMHLYHGVVRRARSDQTLRLEVRVAVILIVMCQRYPRDICELPVSAITVENDVVMIQFAKGVPQPVAGPDAALVCQLLDRRERAGSPWLFRSKPRPEAHMSSHGLCGIIDAAGVDIDLNKLRNAAFRDALRDFSAMEMVEIQGFRNSVAEHWAKRGIGLSSAEKAYTNKLGRAGRRRRRSLTNRRTSKSG